MSDICRIPITLDPGKQAVVAIAASDFHPVVDWLEALARTTSGSEMMGNLHSWLNAAGVPAHRMLPDQLAALAEHLRCDPAFGREAA